MGKRRKCNILTESNKESEDCKGMDLDIVSIPVNNSPEKSSTNAFQLMMESRNKSIGSNSPGKCRTSNEFECQELLEKREVKAKRVQMLQKMAEAKGSLKNKELEDYRDRCIKKQVLKQAEKFKAILTHENTEVKNKPKGNKTKKMTEVELKDDDEICVIDVKKTLQLCNMFEQSDAEVLSKKLPIKKMSPEDKEFLSKLGPSIRKTENMLSYFAVVEKSANESLIEDNEINTIKVKFKSKRKKKKILYKKHESKNKIDNSQNETESSKYEEQHNSNSIQEIQQSESTSLNFNAIKDNSKVLNEDNRPKRNTKRPAKYLDDIELCSSGDELHIFTPKKKKNLRKITHSNIASKIEIDELNHDNNLVPISENKTIKFEKNKQKNIHLQRTTTKTKEFKSENPVKLAPIFLSKQSNLSIAEKEARQKFLHSGIPEKLKKHNSQQQSNNSSLEFQSVVHIQQSRPQALAKIEINFPHLSELCDLNLEINDNLFTFLISANEEFKPIIPPSQYNKEELLQMIKNSYQKFPVYRTYHLLKGKSRGEHKDYNYPDLDNSVEIINGIPSDGESVDKLCWVDKYKPTSSKQIIGNFSSIDELKKWLQSWSENLIKNKKSRESDNSDFEDFQDSDTYSREAWKNNNVLVICGDVGSGKTSSVYAVAAELGIKVIEVNASSKRTGKIMLQDLQEATRSHKVDRGKSNLDNQKSIEKPKPKVAKKRGRPKIVKEDLPKNFVNIEQNKIIELSSSQESVRTDSSLILIDDADIIFEQDDGFCSAISQLVQSSKRPVILITNSLSCQHLQKFIQHGKIIKMNRFLPRMLGTWLDIMCLADTGTCFPGLGDGLLDFYKGDIRKTMHSLQFYMVSYKHFDENSQEMGQDKLNIDDENSNLSWADHDCRKTTQTDTVKSLIQHVKTITFGSPLDLLSVWWSVPKIYETNRENEQISKLKSISNTLNVISEADSFSRTNYNKIRYPRESVSLNESETFEYYNRNQEISNDITRELSLLTVKCNGNDNSESFMDISAPGYSREREYEKIISRHHTLTSYLNPGAVLDRRAVALDYWAACRAISRIEKNNSNTKRNNRFCHYLKSLNILCKNDFFNALTNSLNNDTK